MSESNQRRNRCPFRAFAPCTRECMLIVSYAEWSDAKKHMEKRDSCALAVSCGKPVNYYITEDDDG